MNLVSVKCPNCGGELLINDSYDSCFCQYCDLPSFTNTATAFSQEAEKGVQIDNLDFIIESNVLTKYIGTNSEVIIPINVAAIGAGAFKDLPISNVSMPDSVELIDNDAFYGCTALVDILLPNTIKYIGERAFSNCRSLRSVTLPDTLRNLNTDVFHQCHSLTAVSLPNSLVEIGIGAFTGCGFDSFLLPQSIQKIGHGAFKDCKHLNSIEIPTSVKEIGDSAFRNCKSLKSIHIPATVEKIGNCAFSGCSSLISVLSDSWVGGPGKDNAFNDTAFESAWRKQQHEHLFCAKWREEKLCQHCGGKFKGLFSKICTQCGRKKDY